MMVHSVARMLVETPSNMLSQGGNMPLLQQALLPGSWSVETYLFVFLRYLTIIRGITFVRNDARAFRFCS
jgi:hypothetical protein